MNSIKGWVGPASSFRDLFKSYSKGYWRFRNVVNTAYLERTFDNYVESIKSNLRKQQGWIFK